MRHLVTDLTIEKSKARRERLREQTRLKKVLKNRNRTSFILILFSLLKSVSSLGLSRACPFLDFHFQRLRLLAHLDGLLQRGRGTKAQALLGGNRHRFSRLGIASSAFLGLVRGKGTETVKANFVVGGEFLQEWVGVVEV